LIVAFGAVAYSGNRSRPVAVSWIRRCCESRPWITDANSESWSWDGQNNERSIEDLLPVWVVEDDAGAVAEDM